LGQTGEFDLLDEQAVHRAIKEAVPGPDVGWTCDEIPCAVDIGTRLRAGAVVIGSVSRAGRRVSVETRIVDAYTGKVVGDWTVDSPSGEAGIPEAIGEIVSHVLSLKAGLPRRGERRFPGELPIENALRSKKYQTSLTFRIGLGLHGDNTSWLHCDVLDSVTVYRKHTASFRWLVNLGVSARPVNSRWSIGIEGGASSVKTSWRNTYEDSLHEYSEGGNDRGLNFHLYPRVGCVLVESTGHSVMVFAGPGYRDFSDESRVDSSFLSTGLAVRIHVLRADIVYWRGLDRGSLLKDLVTIDIGLGTGF
jgi:hypothetical protein